MDKSFYTSLKRILALLFCLNAVIIFIVIYLAVSNYSYQKKSLIEMGNTVLRAFEASRPIIFSSGSNKHLSKILQEMFNLDIIKEIIIYRKNGSIIYSMYNNTHIINTKINGQFQQENKSEIILYNSFNLANNFNKAKNRDRFIYIAISISKENLNKIKNLGITIITITFIAEILIFLLFFKLRQLITIYQNFQKKLNIAEKDAATGRLASVLAHEIKNPLSSINGLLLYAEKKCNDNDIKNIITNSKVEIDRLSDIVNDFLTYGRNIELNITNTPAIDIINKTIELLQHDINEKNIKINIIGNNFSFDCDKNKFLQIFVNLILNAIDASPLNDIISITINDKDKSISITNNTKNILEVDKNKFFEPFYTTKTKGSGLGLSITKKLVETHGYSIEILDLSPFVIKLNLQG